MSQYKESHSYNQQYRRQSEVVSREEINTVNNIVPHSTCAEAFFEDSFTSQSSSSLKEDTRCNVDRKVSLSDLPHPSKLRRKKHCSAKPNRKRYSVVESYLQQLKRKQDEFSWISDAGGDNKENTTVGPSQQSLNCSQMNAQDENASFCVVPSPFGGIPAIRSATVVRSSNVLNEIFSGTANKVTGGVGKLFSNKFKPRVFEERHVMPTQEVAFYRDRSPVKSRDDKNVQEYFSSTNLLPRDIHRYSGSSLPPNLRHLRTITSLDGEKRNLYIRDSEE